MRFSSSVSQIHDRVCAVSLRATWRVNCKDKDLEENLIASKWRNLNEKLAKIEGVHFYISLLLVLVEMPRPPGKKRKSETPTNKDAVQTRKMIQ